jgi:hypothetical protein
MQFASQPMTFDAAERWFAQKANLPTGMTSAQISTNLPPRIRNHAFFSAQVAKAHVLDGLRGPVEMLRSGKVNVARAREMMREYLARAGYGMPEPDSKADRDLKNLAGQRRLDLILRQNVAMAHAVGQREVAEHPAVMDYLPNYEYDARDDARGSHAQFDGLILPKTDPFWRTHYPPWEFNCRCMAFDTAAPPNGRSTAWNRTVTGADYGVVTRGRRAVAAGPAGSGFVFQSSPADAFAGISLESIADDALRAAVARAFATRGGGEK